MVQIGVRIEAEWAAEIDEIIAEWRARYPGSKQTRADIARVALRKGLDLLTAEGEAGPPKSKTKAKRG